jgi:broad specificity phosphatase PhoE
VSTEQLSRQEAVEQIQRELGDTEKAAQVIDWTRDLWETIDELYKRLSPALARQVINASRPPTFEEAAAGE